VLQIVIPAFNEELRLGRTLRELRRYVVQSHDTLNRVEVIVVDNTSTDRTAAVAAECDSAAMPVRVVRCPTRGKGAAVREGVLATDADLVAFLDADGATDLAALSEAARLVTLGADVAIASRATAGSVTAARHSRVREGGARMYRSLTAHLVPGVGDTQCGFKMFRGDLARRVFGDLVTVGFSFDVELLARCQLSDARIAEFPATWTDVPGSTFHPLRHGARSFLDLAVIGWRLRDARSARGRVTPLHSAPSVSGVLGMASLEAAILGDAVTTAEV
jgi:glycosyltransferase involved in cell wall biosynthesis